MIKCRNAESTKSANAFAPDFHQTVTRDCGGLALAIRNSVRSVLGSTNFPQAHKEGYHGSAGKDTPAEGEMV